MKNIKKFAKKLLAMIVATTIILASTTSVNAAAESIQLGDASYVGNYIAHMQETISQEFILVIKKQLTVSICTV